MKISIIVAMDEKRGIGKNGKIPWYIRDDLIKLKSLTKDHIVILGRKTYDSMIWYYDRSGKPMPGMLYIVITRDEKYKPARDNATVAQSVENAIKIAKEEQGHSSVIASTSASLSINSAKQSQVEGIASSPSTSLRIPRNDNNEVFIIGGGQIFQQALPLADKLYLTIVKGDYDCDTFFPDYSEFKKVVSKESKESEGHKYKFLEVKR